MKKKFFKRTLSILLALALIFTLPAGNSVIYAAEQKQPDFTEGVWQVPVQMLNATKEQASMGNEAIDGPATVTIENGRATYEVNFKGIEFGGVRGHLLELWDYETEDLNQVPREAIPSGSYEDVDLEGNPATFHKAFQITREVPENVKEEEFFIKISVDAMAGFDQDARLSFDWSQAAYLPEVKRGIAGVSFGTDKAYDVTADVAVLNNKIYDVVFSHNANETGHENSASYADRATTGMPAYLRGISIQNTDSILDVDTVSGATITSEICKDAVLNALKMDVPEQNKGNLFGSNKKELEPGRYKVPIRLRNADKHEKDSAAVKAFPDTATLQVEEDGTASMVSGMGTVSMGPISDMAYEVKYYTTDNYTSTPVPATILEEIDKPEGLPNAGLVKVPVQITFPVPDNSWDGIYMNFKVDAMGGATPDGWLEIMYDQAVPAGQITTLEGSAKVNQFGKYTIHTKVTLTDGVISDVAVTADNFISETHRPTNELKISQVTKNLKHAWDGIAPTPENAEKIYRTILKKDSDYDVIDAVSGATYSANAVRDAVMDACGLEYQVENIHVPEQVKPGIYEVEIGYYSDVVWHSLVEDVTTKAILTVEEDKTMTLEFDTFSGTEKEPLYILDFNGVYPNNDRTKEPVLEGCEYQFGLSVNDYEDEFFKKGTKVVTHVKFPLTGGMNKIYNTNAYLYVPAMKRLNGELSGVYFENGHFNVDIFTKIYWDDMKKIGELPVKQTGWVQKGSEWNYINPDGTKATGFAKIGSNTFYFDKNGRMATGWQAVGTKWYYFYDSGRMLTGWQQIDGHWFYLGTDGVMTKGWKKLGANWFYFNGSGYMATGWQAVGTKWYYFYDSGRMLTGWQQINGYWYYLKSSGEMAKGWQKLGRNWFYFNGSGHMLTGWQKIGVNWFYFKNSGAMAANEKIGTYYVNASGAWVR